MSNYTEILKDDDTLLGYLPISNEGGRLRNIIYMTESGAYTKPDWLKFVIVKGVGGGGGGGGCPATGTGQVALAGGGGGGGYFEKRILAEALAATEDVTVGSGGIGGVGVNPGQAGGTTSFGAHCSASGGLGGGVGAASANSSSAGGAGGTGVGGDITIPGLTPTTTRAISGTLIIYSNSGNSWLSGVCLGGAWNSNGNPGVGPGSGGGGAVNDAQQGVTRNGGNGVASVCIIEEYE